MVVRTYHGDTIRTAIGRQQPRLTLSFDDGASDPQDIGSCAFPAVKVSEQQIRASLQAACDWIYILLADSQRSPGVLLVERQSGSPVCLRTYDRLVYTDERSAVVSAQVFEVGEEELRAGLDGQVTAADEC